MTFRIGQKVVCIADKWSQHRAVVSFPVVGQIYTVKKIINFGAGCGLLLEEIINPPSHWLEGFLEPSWGTVWFKPLVERKTDISIFTRMLKTNEVVS